MRRHVMSNGTIRAVAFLLLLLALPAACGGKGGPAGDASSDAPADPAGDPAGDDAPPGRVVEIASGQFSVGGVPTFLYGGDLQDQPFQADYFTLLYDRYNDIATGEQPYVYAAELQGGFYAYPLVGQPTARPEATDQLLARTVGRGLKGGAFYVIPADAAGYWQWTTTTRAGRFNMELPGDRRREPLSFWYETFWRPRAGAGAEPFAWERDAITGGDRAVIGYLVRDGAGTRVFFGTNVYSRFNSNEYHTWDGDDLEDARALALWLAGLGGEAPIVRAAGLRELAWARRGEGVLYLFVVNDNGDARDVAVTLASGEALGIAAGARYSLRDALGDRALGEKGGAELLAAGVTVRVAAWSTALVAIRPL